MLLHSHRSYPRMSLPHATLVAPKPGAEDDCAAPMFLIGQYESKYYARLCDLLLKAPNAFRGHQFSYLRPKIAEPCLCISA